MGDIGSDEDFYPPPSNNDPLNDSWGESKFQAVTFAPTVAVCQAPCRGSRAVPSSAPPDAAAQTFQYNPDAYREAAAMAEARDAMSLWNAPGSFSAMSSVARYQPTSLPRSNPAPASLRQGYVPAGSL